MGSKRRGTGQRNSRVFRIPFRSCPTANSPLGGIGTLVRESMAQKKRVWARPFLPRSAKRSRRPRTLRLRQTLAASASPPRLGAPARPQLPSRPRPPGAHTRSRRDPCARAFAHADVFSKRPRSGAFALPFRLAPAGRPARRGRGPRRGAGAMAAQAPAPKTRDGPPPQWCAPTGGAQWSIAVMGDGEWSPRSGERGRPTEVSAGDLPPPPTGPMRVGA